MKLSIIIVNWNTKEDLLGCLRSIMRNVSEDLFQKEVVVIDNNSSDGSVAAVKKEFPQITLLANKHNLGLAKAWNQGIRATQGEVIILLNPDVKISANCVENLLSFLNEQPSVGAVGPKLLNSQGEVSNYGYYVELPTLGQFILFRTPLVRLAGRFDFLKKRFMGVSDSQVSQEVDQPPGAFFMVKRAVLDRVGWADEKFFLYYEDVDLAKKIKKVGYKNFYVADAVAVHAGAGSIRKLSDYTQRFYFYSSAAKYFCKHHNLFQGFLVMLIGQASLCLRLLHLFRERKVDREMLKGFFSASKGLLKNWKYSRSYH